MKTDKWFTLILTLLGLVTGYCWGSGIKITKTSNVRLSNIESNLSRIYENTIPPRGSLINTNGEVRLPSALANSRALAKLVREMTELVAASSNLNAAVTELRDSLNHKGPLIVRPLDQMPPSGRGQPLPGGKVTL